MKIDDYREYEFQKRLCKGEDEQKAYLQLFCLMGVSALLALIVKLLGW